MFLQSHSLLCTVIFGDHLERWFVTFIDDHTRMSLVYLMEQKSEVENIYKTFYNMVYNQFETTIKVLRSDNRREYFTKHLSDFFSKK